MRKSVVLLGCLGVLAWAGCGDGDDGPGPHIETLVPARGVAGECVHVVGDRFGAGSSSGSDSGLIFLDGGRRDSGVVVDSGVRDSGVRDGGVVDAAAPARDASLALCFDGDPAPAGGTVAFGGRAARVRAWEDGRLVVEIPAGAGATRVVVTAGGRSSNAVDFQIE